MDIQGLRALAIIMVVLFHAGLGVHGGYLGVDVFFVISGFVITLTLLRELESDGRIRFGAFYVRRIKRLLPALAVMVAVVSLVGILAAPVGGQAQGAKTAAAAAVYLANVFLYRVHDSYFDLAAGLNAFLHTWSLSVEEQFYLLFPPVLLLGWRALRRRGAAAAVLAVALVSYVVWRGLVTVPGVHDAPRFSFYGAPARAWEFGVGALLALGVPLLRRLSQTGAVAIGATGLLTVAVAATAVPDGTSDLAVLPSGFGPLLPVIGTAMLISAGTASTAGVSRMLALRPAVWIGDLSYSWYLWHWPLIVFAVALFPGAGWAAPVAAALSLLPAWLSFRHVEQPFRAAQLAGRRIAVLAAVCAAVPVLVAFGSLRVVRAIDPGGWRQLSPLHADAARGCTTAAALRPAAMSRCTWTVPHARGRVVLIGDSNAGQYTEAVVAGAERAGFSTTVAALPSCPFTGVEVVRGGQVDLACRGFQHAAMAELLRSRPSLVVIGTRTAYYFGSALDRDQEVPELALPGGAAAAAPAAKADVWTAGLAGWLERLHRARIPVVVVLPTPVFPPFVSPGRCAVVRLLTSSCQRTESRTRVETDLAVAVAADRRAARAGGAFAFDPIPLLCSRTACATTRAGLQLYRDARHLSVRGAEMVFTGAFERLVAAHARVD
jgi:peptidoglycan/LPS O-acetylase OafA/YrhL